MLIDEEQEHADQDIVDGGEILSPGAMLGDAGLLSLTEEQEEELASP